jgi:dipeptidyl aminopeptidase/acylaminoacyl peptidase
LKKYNKVFETHSYPGEPHGFRKLANRADLYKRSEAWFNKYLKGATNDTARER